MFRLCLRSVGFLLLCAPLAAYASLVAFDHIEYDPTGADSGHEWVRIHNVSGTPLDLTNWRFVEGGTNHKLRAISGAVVPVGGFAVIADDAAQYAAEHPGGTDIIFDSTFSLSNTGEMLAFTNASSTIVVSESYTATPKPVAVAAPPKQKTAPTKKEPSKKAAPRTLQKETPKITASVADAPVTHDFSFWPWLLGAIVVGVGAGGALWYVRKWRTESGYTVIDISDKSV